MKPITKDIFEIVTTLIIEKLQAGIIPWHQPWGRNGPPRNYLTGRSYRGVNILLLSHLGYATNEFLTFKQVVELGGRVQKGSKAHLLSMWHHHQENQKQRYNFRYYYAFNIAQCNNLPLKPIEVPSTVYSPMELCEMILVDVPSMPTIIYNSESIGYDIIQDVITLPDRHIFSDDEYYFFIFEQLAHATGHESRLHRKELKQTILFDFEPFSMEQLTVEMATGYIAAYTGIRQTLSKPAPDILQGWVNRFDKDKRFVVYAAAQAQKAVDYILNVRNIGNELVSPIQVSYGT